MKHLFCSENIPCIIIYTQNLTRHGHEDSSMSSRTRMRTFKKHEDEDKDEDRLLK